MYKHQKPPARPFSFDKLQEKLAAKAGALAHTKEPEHALRIYQEELLQQHEALCAAQMELEASRDRYAELFEYAPVAYLVLSPTGNIEEINFNGAAMLGYSRAWLIGSPFYLYVLKKDVPLYFEHLARCKNRTTPILTELELKRKDGTTFSAEIVTAPEQENLSKSHGLRTTITDTTIHKCTEGTLRCAYDELEERVRQRTAELTHALKKLSLQTAERQNLERELAEISERERRRFGQDLHDDLCQQLAGIALSATALSKTLARSGMREAHESLQIAEAINATIAQAKDIARGLHPVELAKGGLAAALRDVVSRNNSRQRCRFLKIGPLPELSEEASLALFRIGQEAIHNAVKHALANHITVRLSGSKQGLKLTVRDDGGGIPQDACKTKGMGLSIMRYRANAIGADLSVESSQAGTVVTCSLQLDETNAMLGSASPSRKPATR